jgi:hypothetical protein
MPVTTRSAVHSNNVHGTSRHHLSLPARIDANGALPIPHHALGSAASGA